MTLLEFNSMLSRENRQIKYLLNSNYVVTRVRVRTHSSSLDWDILIDMAVYGYHSGEIEPGTTRTDCVYVPYDFDKQGLAYLSNLRELQYENALQRNGRVPKFKTLARHNHEVQEREYYAKYGRT